MHFSIPNTQELTDDNGKSFTAYNIHVNGVFHCTVRYKQLNNLQEQLKRAFHQVELPPFPPKKLLSLSEEDVEIRRCQLEKYVQQASQCYPIINSGMFSEFFLSAQRETRQETPSEVTLDIYLMNGHKFTTKIMSTDQTDSVLEQAASEISLTDQYVYYFGLYLVKRNSKGESEIVRKLQDFESPFLSLKAANEAVTHKIVLRKSFWESNMEDELVSDRVVMNLLYVQAVNDVEKGWVEVDEEQKSQLDSYKRKNSKKEYLQMAKTLKYYGFLHFINCVTNFPEEGTQVDIAAGNKELHFRVTLQEGKTKEAVFRVTRMRCWRITSVTKTGKAASMELSFEYLMAKDNLSWVTVTTDRAIFLSMCLQGMVDELMMKKEGKRMRVPQDRVKNSKSLAYMNRDGTLTGEMYDKPEGATMQKVKDSVSKISDKFSAINFRSKQRSDSHDTEKQTASNSSNSAFKGINDDDL